MVRSLKQFAILMVTICVRNELKLVYLADKGNIEIEMGEINL